MWTLDTTFLPFLRDSILNFFFNMNKSNEESLRGSLVLPVMRCHGTIEMFSITLFPFFQTIIFQTIIVRPNNYFCANNLFRPNNHFFVQIILSNHFSTKQSFLFKQSFFEQTFIFEQTITF